MKFKKMKQLKDERIMRESNKITSKMYWVVLPLLMGYLIYKIAMGMELKTYIIELLCLFTTVPYMIMNIFLKGLYSVKNPDEHIIELRRKTYAICFSACFFIILFGEFIYMLLFPKEAIIYGTYLLIWFGPALIITIYAIRKGLLIWGSTKRKKEGTRELKKRVVIGSLFFGIIMGSPFVYSNGTYHPSGLLWILGMAFGWGLPFYFIFNLMIKKSEMKAEAQLSLAENEEDLIYEEQENEDSKN